LRIDLTKEEDYTGLRTIDLDRSGPKVNKIQAQFESPTAASSAPAVSFIALIEMWCSKVVVHLESRILRNQRSDKLNFEAFLSKPE